MPPYKRNELNLKFVAEPQLNFTQKENWLEGIRLFNSGLYFEAHDVWEHAWLEMGNEVSDDGEIIFRGMIQFAAALHCHLKGKHKGTDRHLDKSLRKLKLVQNRFLGVDINNIVDAIRTKKDKPELLIGYQLKLNS